MNGLLSLADIFTETDAIVCAETPSEYDGKCLHCDSYLPCGACGRCLKNESYTEVFPENTCSKYTPNPQEEISPWNPDPYYFQIYQRRVWRAITLEDLGIATISSRNLETIRAQYTPGTKIGCMTIVSEVGLKPYCGQLGYFVNARCDFCGSVKEYLASELRRRKSCGCEAIKGTIARHNQKKSENCAELIGKKFGVLTVIGLAPSRRDKSGHWKSVYLCKCECGNVCEKYREKLIAGNRVGACEKCRHEKVLATKRAKTIAKINARNGERSGGLVLVGYSHTENYNTFAKLKCAQCGKEVLSPAKYLKRVCPHCGFKG